MTTALFTDAELICFDDHILTIIRKIKNQYQRADINSIHKKIIKILDYHDVSKDFLNIRIENLLKNGRVRNITLTEKILVCSKSCSNRNPNKRRFLFRFACCNTINRI